MQTSSSKTTVWILGDQLNSGISSLAGLDKSECMVLMIESLARARQRPYHKQKLVFIWSAMHHFAQELWELGYGVDYYEAQPNLQAGLAAHFKDYRPSQFRLMETAEYGRSARLAALVEKYNVPVEVTPNTMFLSQPAEFARSARGKKTLLLEQFYRQMRRQTGLLMDGDTPEGGRWNYDPQNRQRPPADHVFPQIPRYAPDQITEAVIELVEREFSAHFGEVDNFWLPVTRQEANHIAGINPQAVNEWYWLAYMDAFEWVVTPNVLGLALYADGGLLATKPYAASANYINKMSNCCAGCAYNHRQTVGENACPFNALYWDFLARNYPTLKQNPRMNLVMALYDNRNKWLAISSAGDANCGSRPRWASRPANLPASSWIA